MAKLSSELQRTKDENIHVDDQIIKFACAKLSTDPKVIEAHVQAIMYEPVVGIKSLRSSL